MFDFGLTPKGDLMFIHNSYKPEPFKISFNVSDGKALLIKFKAENFLPIRSDDNSLKISFDIDKIEYDKKALIYYDNDARIQALYIRLQTCIEDIADREDIGSKLELLKHKQLFDQNIIPTAISIVKEAIFDIAPAAEVNIEPAVEEINEYSQKLVISIYEDAQLLLKYELKG